LSLEFHEVNITSFSSIYKLEEETISNIDGCLLKERDILIKRSYMIPEFAKLIKDEY
jgi:hypothetical protein